MGEPLSYVSATDGDSDFCVRSSLLQGDVTETQLAATNRN